MLDSSISYEGLKIDYDDDMILSDHLEDSKTNLFKYFDNHYAMHTPTPLTSPSTPVQAQPVNGSSQKLFTAWYLQKEKYSTNELEEYFKLPAEDFNSCNPIQWWVGRQGQFPCLFQLACNIHCIPDKYFGKFNSYNSNLSLSLVIGMSLTTILLWQHTLKGKAIL